MTGFFGPLDSIGRISPRQQTRVAAFLISAHGALARQLAFSVPQQMKAGWQTELNAQFYRESEIVSLLLRATSWTVDLELPMLVATWEVAWLPRSVSGLSDRTLASTIDVAALGHAVHGAIRPAALLPDRALAEDPFVTALRRIEFESGRMIQAQILFLKGQDLLPYRDAVNTAVEDRHRQVRDLWDVMLKGIGVERGASGQAVPYATPAPT
jgi:hypothetical protein